MMSSIRDLFKIYFSLLILWLLPISGVYSQSCIYESSANDITPDKLCAPVTVDWIVSYRKVDDGGTKWVDIYIDWGDGTPAETIPATEYESTNWRINTTHVYPNKGDQCNYEPRAMLMVDGVLCTSSIQTQNVTVWDVDNQNGGELNINPKVFPICLGNDGTVQFADASKWNCNPTIEKDNPNTRNRWTQWIYGTGGTTITTAKVGGTQYPWPYKAAIEYYSAPATGPTPPPSLSENVTIPAGYDVGDFFEVTIRNWNTCNPYDDPNIDGPPSDPVNGDHAPIETTAMALIVALPDGSITPAGPFCENASPELLSAATKGGTWNGPGVDPATGLFDPAAAGTGTHHLTYEVTDPNGCPASGAVDIEVLGSPKADIISGTAIALCPGISQILNTSITGGTPPYNITWSGDTSPLDAINVASPTFSTLSEGLYHLTVTVTDQKGCQTHAETTVTVAAITVSFAPTTIEVCAGQPIQLKPIVTGGSGNYTTHTWTGTATDKLSDPHIAEPLFTSNEVGPVVLTYHATDDQGCNSQGDITIQVKSSPTADAGPDQVVCDLTLPMTAKDPAPAIGQWTVLSGPGSISFSDPTAPTSQVTADITGTYHLLWQVSQDGCSSSDEITINFSQIPAPSTGPDVSTCGLTAPLHAVPDLPFGHWEMTSGPGASTFDDTTNPQTNVTVNQPGDYTYSWIEETANHCIGQSQQNISFLPQAQAIIDPFDAEGCSPQEITFSNKSQNAQAYQWDFGDASSSTQQDPVHIYENHTTAPITRTLTLIALNSNTCHDTLEMAITTYPSPTAAITANPLSGCSPLEVSFSNTSSGSDSYTWNFGDTSVESHEKEPIHSFINTKDYIENYPAKLTVTNSYACVDSAQTFVSVFPSRDIALTATPNEGCSPLEVTFVADAGFREYAWDFGDGESTTGAFQITHTFENHTLADMSFNVSVTGTTALGCVNTESTEVTVHPSPVINFSATPANMQMPESTVTLTNNTNGNWNYLWSFGDSQTFDGAHPTPHTYTNSGTFDIVLKASDEHCQSQATQTITISPMLPAIAYGEDAEGCPPLTVSFWNKTIDATNYLWEFGDGQISGEINPTHTYLIPGVFHVKLTATGPGGTSTSDEVTIHVYPTPTALFEARPSVIYIPDSEAAFLNRSTGAIKYLWNFGDGNTSTEFIPHHTYTTPGLYDVTLKVENEEGCTHEFTALGAIKAEQGGELAFPNAFTPSPDGPQDGQYEFGDRRNQIFYPSVQKGIVEYELEIFTRWGELIFRSTDVKRGWDGYYKNKLCPQGVYIWKVRAKFSNGHTSTRAGDVTLLR